jgi:hypothetical protein
MAKERRICDLKERCFRHTVNGPGTFKVKSTSNRKNCCKQCSKICREIYEASPEYKEKTRSYSKTAKGIATRRAWSTTPEQRAKKREYNEVRRDKIRTAVSTPEARAKQKAYRQRPDIQAREIARRKTPEYKAARIKLLEKIKDEKKKLHTRK